MDQATKRTTVRLCAMVSLSKRCTSVEFNAQFIVPSSQFFYSFQETSYFEPNQKLCKIFEKLKLVCLAASPFFVAREYFMRVSVVGEENAHFVE